MSKIILAPTLDDALSALSERAIENESRGERTIVFCEDKLTLLAERAVLGGRGELSGTFLTEVTTFKRYLSGDRAVLSKEGSVMEIENLILSHGDKLNCFGKGSARAVYETIAQLSASRVDAPLLRASAEDCEGMLRTKLLDLALLLELYEAFLQERGLVDESGYLSLLPEKLRGSLRGVHVVFFAFTSFTRQAAEGVRAAFENAGSVTGIFLSDSEGAYTNEAAGIFRRIADEYGGGKVSRVPSTLVGNAELLRKGLFSFERFAAGRRKGECVHAFGAADEAEEMDLVAALIKKYTAEGKRYSDLAVLVPDEGYFPLAEKAFSAYHIPMFADKKRTLAEHPFCTFVLAVLNAVHDGVLPDEADDIASSAYFGHGDNYRNYLLKFGGYRGAVKREIKEGEAVKDYSRDELLSCRERMLGILSLFPRTGKGAAFAQGVRALYEYVDGGKVTETLRAAFTGAEREFLDLYTRLDGVLRETEVVSSSRTFTAREFALLLESGLKAVTASMIPQYADAVFVGDATESRIRRAKVLFAVGLTDALPRVSNDTAVITDGEIEGLSRLKVEIEPAIAQVNARARENLMLNMSAFTEALYLSCPARKKGEETAHSEVLSYIDKMFEIAPMPEIFPYNCSEAGPACLNYLALSQDYPAGRSYERGEGEALKAALVETGEWEKLERFLSGGKAPVPEASQLWFHGDISPTLLENYFACPYAGFASRALRLREREERTVLDTDAGTFVHAVLERVAPHFNEMENEAACRALAEKEGTELLSTPRFVALTDTEAGKYTSERLKAEGAEVAAAAYRQLSASKFRVRETEGKISLPDLLISGKTDRVDAADDLVRIIDYKTGNIDDKPLSYYTGRKLQLQLYLRAAAEGGTAAGAFYFPAASEFTEEGEEKWRMKGFYCGDDAVVTSMDTTLKAGDKSVHFEGSLGGRALDKGMDRDTFENFLDYSLLVSARAEEEMKAGNVLPSPYEKACDYCKFRGMCGFDGAPRKERSVKCAQIANIVRRERGEKC